MKRILKAIALVVGCCVAFLIVVAGVIIAILLIGDYYYGMQTVDMEPYKEKYTGYADVIAAYDHRIDIGESNADLDGSYRQLYGFELDGIYYDFMFECNIYGKENIEISVSTIEETLDIESLDLFITMCMDFSKEPIEETLMREKCEEALATGYGRFSKNTSFEFNEYGYLTFCSNWIK